MIKEKKILTVDDLTTLSEITNDNKTYEILVKTRNILQNNTNKYLFKRAKDELEEIGFKANMIKFGTAESHLFATKSKQIDILDNKILRVGMGQDKPYEARWLEIEIKI